MVDRQSPICGGFLSEGGSFDITEILFGGGASLEITDFRSNGISFEVLFDMMDFLRGNSPGGVTRSGKVGV